VTLDLGQVPVGCVSSARLGGIGAEVVSGRRHRLAGPP
jgi:hypothetical protein